MILHVRNRGVGTILLHPLPVVKVVGGDILKLLSIGEAAFHGFEEAYISKVDYQVEKGAKRHLEMTLNLFVLFGEVNFCFLDASGGVRRETLSSATPCRLTVPPGIWFSFKGMSESQSWVLNLSNVMHCTDEIENMNLEEFHSQMQTKSVL